MPLVLTVLESFTVGSSAGLGKTPGEAGGVA